MSCPYVASLVFLIDPEDQAKEILTHIVRRHGVSKTRKLAYLNLFVKFCSRFDDESAGCSADEVIFR